MKKVLLMSHGKFAEGIKSSVDVLMGGDDNLTVFNAYINEDSMEDFLADYFNRIDSNDQVIMMSDVFCGSINQKMVLKLNRPDTFLITGINLPCVLEVLMNIEDKLTKQQIENIVDESRLALKIIELDKNEEDTENEDFLGEK